MISILLLFSCSGYLWLHDVLGHENFYDGFQYHVDGVFVQSDFHRGTLPTFLQEKTIVLPHGLDSNYPPLPLNDAVVNQQRDDKIEIINSNHMFIYFGSMFGFSIIIDHHGSLLTIMDHAWS